MTIMRIIAIMTKVLMHIMFCNCHNSEYQCLNVISVIIVQNAIMDIIVSYWI